MMGVVPRTAKPASVRQSGYVFEDMLYLNPSKLLDVQLYQKRFLIYLAIRRYLSAHYAIDYWNILGYDIHDYGGANRKHLK